MVRTTWPPTRITWFQNVADPSTFSTPDLGAGREELLDGAPTPVAWTRMLAPAASMGAMPADWLSNGVASSPLQAKYGQDINRESAYEMLTQRLEAGAARAQQEADAAAQAKEQAAQDKAEAAQERASAPRTSSRTSSRPAPRSGVEKVLGSATFWNQVIRVGGQVVRTMWGTAKR